MELIVSLVILERWVVLQNRLKVILELSLEVGLASRVG